MATAMNAKRNISTAPARGRTMGASKTASSTGSANGWSLRGIVSPGICVHVVEIAWDKQVRAAAGGLDRRWGPCYHPRMSQSPKNQSERGRPPSQGGNGGARIYADLKSQAAKRALRKICDADDLGELARFLEQRRSGPQSAHDGSKAAMIEAIESDAACIFGWLASPQAGAFEVRLDEPLASGVCPAWRCCEPRTDKGSAAALACLAICLERDPDCWHRAGRAVHRIGLWSPLAVAAQIQDAGAFSMLAKAASEAVGSGRVAREKFEESMSMALWASMDSSCPPQAVLEKLEAMQALGFDWKSARTARGSSALGMAMGGGKSRTCHGRLAQALVRSGASPLLPFSPEPKWGEDEVEEGYPVSCLERILSPVEFGWVDQPELALALVEAASDADFEAAMEKAYQGYRPGLIEEYLTRAPGEAKAGLRIWERHCALSQAKALADAVPEKELRTAMGSAGKRSL